MRIGGLQKCSLIDFPNHIAAIVFTQGCPWRCAYCHNPSLVAPEQFCPQLPTEDVLNFLKGRVGQLDGVVISGGEPTLQSDLADFIRAVRDMGYAIKLDTNGIYSDRLAPLLKAGLIDYVAMDIKATLENYPAVVGVPVSPDTITRSMELIRKSGVAYEFRTTVVPQLPIDPLQIRQLLKAGERYYLQAFRPSDNNMNPELSEKVSLELQETLAAPLCAAGLAASWR